ncbi:MULTISPECIES: DHA2 family efflux MFS transporter permease subunit [unclassified Sporolactobacillus]|uniref:DHA2 family efflux MFS transporter permease subunit n=1 Tax=unclassified Sporolactobacillus TaxID=2628533 RepID=UPI0023676084|nr:DHA2 family efflux MFS transporter permease subunit [Sporolactobacillus sp. CQH2019]MDD9149054.1 DHA2 family efflux MFS transporter permease subunit [Sporolactobacillus sp. CQH2019]
MSSFLSVYSGSALVFLILINVIILYRRRTGRRQAFNKVAAVPDNIQSPDHVHGSEQPADISLLPETGNGQARTAGGKIRNQTESQSHVPVVAILLLGAFVALLNQTLMNVALPKMMTDLNISTNTAQWITTGYMLVNGVLIPITAFLMETFTTRKLFISAMSLFTIGTLICALSPNFFILMVGRVVQASGAGIIMPLMTNVFLTVFPPEKRGGAMGLMGLAMIFAPAVGPTLSGYIVEHYTWRLLFWVVFPIGLIDILLALRFLRNVGRRSFPKLDLPGVVLSTIGFGGILYAFSEAGNNGWNNTEVISTLIIGMIALAFFVWRELTTETPVLELRVFRYGIFTLTTLVNILVTMAMFAAMILLPIYLQNIRGFTPLQSGLLLLPGALLMGAMSPLTGILFDRIGSRPLAIAGLIITTITTWQFSMLSDTTSYGHIMLLYSTRMFGMSLLMMPIMTEGLNDLPRELNSHGTAMSNTVRQVAGALGTAFLVTVMTNRATYHVGEYANHLTKDNPVLMQQLGAAGNVLAGTGHAGSAAGMSGVMQLLETKVEQLATIQGINDSFIVATGLTLLALILSFFIKRATPSRRKKKIKAEAKISTGESEAHA